MIHHREKDEVRRFDIFKLIVLLILIALLLWFWLSPPAFVQGPDEMADDTAVATEAETAVESDSVPGSEPEEETVPAVDTPELESPTPTAVLDIPTLELPEGDQFAGPVRLSGTGTPGSEVAIVIDDALAGTATVGEDGTWSFDTELAAGNHGLHVQALDADGNVAGESEGLGLALVERTPPALADSSYEFTPGVVDFAGVGTPGTTIELLANGEVVGTAVVAADGTWAMPATLEAGEYDLSLRMVAEDGSLLAEVEGASATVAAAETDTFALPTFDLPEGDLAGGDVTLTGTGTPGSEVEIVVNGEVVGTAVVTDDGIWEFPTTLTAGDYELALRTMDSAGTAVETEPVSFSLMEAEPLPESPDDGSSAGGESTISTVPADFCANATPGIDQGDTYVVGVCEWLTKIANRLGIPYADLIGVNPQIENPNLIYPGQIINLPPR